MHVAALDASARQARGVAIRPVIATVRAVYVAAGADPFLRAAAEFADGDQKRVFEHAALVHVVDQGGEARVEQRAGLGLHPLS